MVIQHTCFTGIKCEGQSFCHHFIRQNVIQRNNTHNNEIRHNGSSRMTRSKMTFIRTTLSRGRIFSGVRPFYEQVVSDLGRSRHRSLWVQVTHSSFIEGSHMTKNTVISRMPLRRTTLTIIILNGMYFRRMTMFHDSNEKNDKQQIGTVE